MNLLWETLRWVPTAAVLLAMPVTLYKQNPEHSCVVNVLDRRLRTKMVCYYVTPYPEVGRLTCCVRLLAAFSWLLFWHSMLLSLLSVMELSLSMQEYRRLVR